MKVGDLVELSQYGKNLQCRWRERGKLGIIVKCVRWDVFAVQWVGLDRRDFRRHAWRYDRRELKFAKSEKKNN